MKKIEICQSQFDPYRILSDFSSQLDMNKSGGCVNFIGSMRDMNEGDDVISMQLEYYPGMTEKVLGKLADYAIQNWTLNDLLLIHRVGNIMPGEAIVLVAVWSEHRAEAFTACRYLIDELKSNAPFWKKEQLNSASRWLDKNTL